MKHFKLSEFERSNVAKELGISNYVPNVYKANIYNLVDEVLDPVREYFNAPVIITSGYRCPALNEAVGGAKTSQHLFGCAADIKVTSISPLKVWEYIKNELDFDQVILYNTFVHVSYDIRSQHRNHSIVDRSYRAKR